MVLGSRNIWGDEEKTLHPFIYYQWEISLLSETYIDDSINLKHPFSYYVQSNLLTLSMERDNQITK